ncbi:MAG: YitT family protein [Clostridiaceae bacterium]|nr:YitT family protein [Clostridiaceae bacterium]
MTEQTKLNPPQTAQLVPRIRAVLVLIAGSAISALALNVFFIPARLTMGGISGLVSIIYQLTGQGELLPFGIMVIMMNIPILIMGWVYIGSGFVWRSIVGTLAYSVVIDLTEPAMAGWYQEYIRQPFSDGVPDALLFTLFGGILYGIGLGLIFRAGYTTGGTDIIAVLLKRKIKHLSIGQFLLVIDAAIVIFTVFVYRNHDESAVLLAMYSFIAMYLTSKSIDIVLEGFDYTRTAFIISDHSEEIGSRVMDQLQRGVTALHGEGMYTGKSKKVLLCVLSRKQIPLLKAIVLDIDPDAFVIVGEAREVLGEGFGSASDLL